MRFLRLDRYLAEVLDHGRLDAVGYEEVRRHAGTDAGHIYGGVVGKIQEECERRCVPYSGVPVGTVKKLATGKGNANKQAMVEAFRRRFGREPEDDNEADAAFVALTLADQLGQLQPAKPADWREG